MVFWTSSSGGVDAMVVGEKEQSLESMRFGECAETLLLLLICK